jgi:hypothetical protein
MMALFAKSTPLATAIANRDKIRNRLKDNDDAILAATANANTLALNDATDAELSVAENQVRCRVDRRKTLEAALVEADALVAKLEAERDEAADQKQRGETVAGNRKLKDELNAEITTFVASATKLRSTLERTALTVPEAGAFKNFCDVLVQQAPEAVALFCREIDNNSAAVLRHDAPARGKQLPVPLVPVAIAKPVRMELFCLRSVKYIDPDSGEQIVIRKCQDGAFPPSYAKIALEQKIAVRLSDPLRRQHHGSVGGHADEALAFDLDLAMSDPKPTSADPITASAPVSPFVPNPDVRPPYTAMMKVAR